MQARCLRSGVILASRCYFSRGQHCPSPFDPLIQYVRYWAYEVLMKTKQPFQDIIPDGCIRFGEVFVPVDAVRLQLTQVSCLFLPDFVMDEALGQDLAPYGKVKNLDHVTFKDFPTVLTGTPRLQMVTNQQNAVPNLLRVAGRHTSFDYRGVDKVCRRCRQEGHFHTQR